MEKDTTKRIYLVAVDQSYPFDPIEFQDHIKSLCPRHIHAWWHYLEAPLYFVQSHLSATDLYNLIYPYIPSRRCVVMPVNAKYAQGWLPKAAWEWFKNKIGK